MNSFKSSKTFPGHINLANFIHLLYKKGASYNTVNVARSAVSAYLSSSDRESLGKHPVVCRVVKGVFENRPALPRYTEIWDINILLTHLSNIELNNNLKLLNLAMKTACLLLLSTGQRCQSIHGLKTKDIKFSDGKMTVCYSSLLKQSKPNYHLKPSVVSQFEVQNLCPVRHVKCYIEKTEKLRSNDDKLFITSIKPYTHISKDTFARWIKVSLENAGIKEFGPHSVRSASTSAAVDRIDVDKVLEAGGWSNVHTFAKFYRREKCSNATCTSATFSQTVLDSFMQKN